jgi:hypothetical protein
MKTHEYAEKLKAAAEFLASRENVELGTLYIPIFFYDRQPFVDAVRAFGPGDKAFTDSELGFIPKAPCDFFKLYIPRNRVCKLVRPAEYDCEPILSDEEVATLGK